MRKLLLLLALIHSLAFGATNDLKVPGTLTVTGAQTNASTIQSTRYISTIATGTAPLAVTSATQVANLNAATSGVAGVATTGTTAAVTNNAFYFPLFAASATNGNQAFNLGAKLQYNPSYAYGTGGSTGTAIAMSNGGLYLTLADSDPSYGIDINPIVPADFGTRILSYSGIGFCFTSAYPTIACQQRIGNDGRINSVSNGGYTWQSGVSLASGTIDTGLTRSAAGVVAVGTGASGNTAGGVALSSILLPSKLLHSATAPTIASGLCTSPSISASNGNAAFAITVGSSCTGVSTGTLTLPTATTGWVCHFNNVTNPATSTPSQTGGSTTSVTFTNYARTTGLAADFTAADSIRVMCAAY